MEGYTLARYDALELAGNRLPPLDPLEEATHWRKYAADYRRNAAELRSVHPAPSVGQMNRAALFVRAAARLDRRAEALEAAARHAEPRHRPEPLRLNPDGILPIPQLDELDDTQQTAA